MVSAADKKLYEDSFYTGVQVKIGKHTQVDPADARSSAWKPTMDKFVGISTVVTALLGVDAWGYTMVKIDSDRGAHDWRVMSMDNLSDGTRPPTGPTMTNTPSAPAQPKDPPKDKKDKTIVDCLTDWNKQRIRELNEMAERNASIDPY